MAGAGPGGLMTALGLAREGLSVLVVDKRSKDSLGKPVRVSLEKRTFDEVDVDPPQPPELCEPPVAREYISPDTRHKIIVKDAPLLTVSLRELAARLMEEAREEGARFLFDTEVQGPVLELGWVAGVRAISSDGSEVELRARLCVDASGVHGVLRRHLTEGMGVQREIDPEAVASAWQESREIDRPAVMDLVQKNRIRPQVNVTRVGFMGPFSMFSIYVDLEDDRVDITVGLLHRADLPEARELALGYVDSHQWVGERITAGGGLVPVARPMHSFVANGFACVGDAACQAVPQHASGVSSSLLAGKILAETAAEALRSGGASREALWPYNARFMAARGSAQANSELFRRFLVSSSTEELSALFAAGLVSDQGITGAMDGQALDLPLAGIISSVPRLVKRPGLLLRLMRLSRDASQLLKIYDLYPGRERIDTLAIWSSKADSIFSK